MASTSNLNPILQKWSQCKLIKKQHPERTVADVEEQEGTNVVPLEQRGSKASTQQ